MNRLCLALIFFLNFISQSIFSQSDHDTFNHADVEIFYIKNFKKTFNDLSSLKVFLLHDKPEYTQQKLDDFLQKNSSIFIKKLGVNSLTTLSLRGSSSSQSLVLWEGIPIQNSMTGSTDISLFNAGLFDRIEVEYDGNSSLYGSGQVGGAVQLFSVFKSDKNFDFNAGGQLGSFQNLSAYLNTYFSKAGNNFYIKTQARHASNDFKYSYQNEQHLLSNAHNKAFSLITGWENNHIFKSRFSLPRSSMSYHFWFQKNNRGIPPAFFENTSTKVQDETSFRHNLKFTSILRNNSVVYLHTAWLHDIHQYSDSEAFITQNLSAHNVYSELGFKNQKSIQVADIHIDYLAFIPIHFSQLKNQKSNSKYSNFYSGLSGILQARFLENFYLQANVRKEFNDNYNSPLLYGSKLAYHLPTIEAFDFNHKFHLFTSYQKSFRAPLLHELHQFPGGNPNLKPEHGHNLETGFKSSHFNPEKKYELSTQIVYFNKKINDWIYWLGATIWSPHNIAQVHSRGWDIQLHNLYHFNAHSRMHVNIDHSYTISVTTDSKIPNNTSIGKQIPYTPRYNTRINAGYTHQDWLLNLNLGYTGYVFTTLDESAYIEPYVLVNTSVNFPLMTLKKYKLVGNFEVNNILNQTYFTIQHRPMPGINYNLSIHILPE